MVTICLQCGDEGAANAFVYCIYCLKYAVHRYCLDEWPETLEEFVPWVCDDCEFVGVAQKGTSRSQDQDQDRTSSIHVESSCKKQLLEGKTTTTQTVNVSECTPLKLKQKSNNTAATLQVTKQLSQSVSSQQLLGKKAETGSPQQSLEKNNNTLEKKGRRKNTVSQKQRLKSRLSGKTSNSNVLNEVASDSTVQLDHRRPNTNLKDIDQAHNELDSNKLKKRQRHPDSFAADASQAAGLDREETHRSPLSKLSPVSSEIAQPVIDPIWSGSFNIINRKKEVDDVDTLVVAHLSKKVGRQVFDEAMLFPSMLELELHPKADVWPKRFQKLKPSDDDIAIYFFPILNSEGVFHEIVEEMMIGELALKAITEHAELLVFPSNELPLNFWRFQEKYFLWGVFRGKQAAI